MSLFVSLRKEIIQQWRTSRLIIAGAVLIVFGMTSPLLAKFTPQMLQMLPGAEDISALIPDPTITDAVAQYIKNTAQFGVILAFLLTMGAIAVEKEKGTALMMLVKPLPRSAFVVSKFLALAFTFILSIAVAGLGAYYYTTLLFEQPAAMPWLYMNLLVLANILFYVALTLFFSALMRSQVAALGLSFGTMLLLNIVGISDKIAVLLPDSLLQWGVQTALGLPGTANWTALAVTLGLIVLLVSGAWLVFRKQEL